MAVAMATVVIVAVALGQVTACVVRWKGVGMTHVVVRSEQQPDSTFFVSRQDFLCLVGSLYRYNRYHASRRS